MEDLRRVITQLREALDPFSELSPDGQEALRSFAQDLAFWVGNTNSYHLKSLRAEWSKSKELKNWLRRHVNQSATLYFGARVKTAADLPEAGAVMKRKGNVSHWSKNRATARWFAAGGDGGGYILEARPPVGSIIIDVDRFSTLCGQHRESFKKLMTRKDPVDIFNGSQYEGEVITTAVKARVVEIVAAGS